MSQFVAGNRLRTHIASGTFGAGGTTVDASGEIAIVHGFPADAPAAFGITLNTSDVGGVIQSSRYAFARLSGLVLAVRICSVINTGATSSTCQGIWWAKM